MTRPLKFRVWGYGSIMQSFDLEEYARDQDREYGQRCLDLATRPLMQFTGLLDCHGKEIYEGDIVTFDTRDIGGAQVTGEVIWNDDQTLGPMLGWGLWTPRGFLPTDFLGKLDILGNIYEHPHLVEQGQ